MNTKKLLIASAGIALIVNIIVPVMVFANPLPVNPLATSTITTTTPAKVKACLKLPTAEEKTNKNLSDRAAKLESNQQTALEKVKEKRDNINSVRSLHRAWWDEKWTGNLKALERRAKTDAQKEAITIFKATASTTVVTRRAAVDLAVSTFRTGMDKAIADRQAAMKIALDTFSTSVKAIIEKAKADCGVGIVSKTVKTEMQTALKDARNKLEIDRKAVAKVAVSSKELTAVKQAAFKKAQEDFNTAIEAARKTLQETFKVIKTKTATTTAQ